MVRPAPTFRGPLALPRLPGMVSVDTGEGDLLVNAGRSMFDAAQRIGVQTDRATLIRAEREGRLAGSTANLLNTDTGEITPGIPQRADATPFARAFNEAAMASAQVRFDTMARQQISTMYEEHRNDPQGFRARVEGWSSGIRQTMPVEMRPWWDRTVTMLAMPRMKDTADNALSIRDQENAAAIESWKLASETDAYQSGLIIGKGGSGAEDAYLSLIESYTAGVNTVRGRINDVNFTEGEAALEIERHSSTLVSSVLKGMFDGSANKGAMLRKLMKGELVAPVPVIDENGQATLQNVNVAQLLGPTDAGKVLAYMNGRAGVLGAQVSSRATDHFASLASTGVPVAGVREEAAAFYDEADLAAFRQREALALASYETQEILKRATPEEAAVVLSTLEPVPGQQGFEGQEKLYNAARNRAAQLFKARQDDPAGYVGSLTPEIAEAETPAQQARMSLETQEQIGIPEVDQRVLPKATAKTMVQQLQGLPPAERGPAIRQLMGAYGENGGAVLSQLNEQGLPAGSGMLTIFADDPVLGQVAAGAIETPAKDLKAGLDPTEIKDAKDSLRDELAPLFRTMSLVDPTGSNRGYIAELGGGLESMALLLANQTGDMPGAVETVVQAMRDRYEVRDTYFIPKTLDNQPVDIAAVEDGLEVAMSRESLAAFQPVALTADPRRQAPGDAALTDEWIETIMNSSIFITLPDGTGVEQVVPVPESGGYIPILNIEGKRRIIRFRDAEIMGRGRTPLSESPESGMVN